MIIKLHSSSVNAYIDILVCGLVFTVVCLACLARLGVHGGDGVGVDGEGVDGDGGDGDGGDGDVLW